MESFVTTHRSQLEALNIPEVLYEELYERLTACIRREKCRIDVDHVLENCQPAKALSDASPLGGIFVVPHIISWDMSNHKGMMQELEKLSDEAIAKLFKALQDQVWPQQTQRLTVNPDTATRSDLINVILQPATWSRVILYRSTDNRIRAALPAPPFYPQCDMTQEPDLTGPFPFRYTYESTVIDTSLVYLSPELKDANATPTIDLVPSHTCPNDATRYVRYAALLGLHSAPPAALATPKLLYAEFTREYHLQRQAKLEAEAGIISSVDEPEATTQSNAPEDAVLRVYTDANDPMELGHKEAGLDPKKYQLVDNVMDADIIYSYQSIFAVMSKVFPYLQGTERTLYINQFPYEGAFVQKDHLALEVLKQHGLPRPSWSIETYDLDVHLGVFVGAAVMAEEQSPHPPVWIVKPARGTQSKGHLITRSTAHILRLVDAGIHSWVVQRYIERPVCYQGRKVDCRCIVMLCDATWKPQIYMHKRVYFRIANKMHSIDEEFELLDHERVLTANHLLTDDHRSTDDPLQTLPLDSKTIATLQAQYAGFDWDHAILPQIHVMIRELFNGMTRAYPAMAQGRHSSRAVYGVDIMFQIESDDSITVKLTEVTFCPANNAVCDAYERDPELYRTYNTDMFDCLFRNVVSDRIVRLQ